MSKQKNSDNVAEQVDPVKKHALKRNQEIYNPCYKVFNYFIIVRHSIV